MSPAARALFRAVYVTGHTLDLVPGSVSGVVRWVGFSGWIQKGGSQTRSKRWYSLFWTSLEADQKRLDTQQQLFSASAWYQILTHRKYRPPHHPIDRIYSDLGFIGVLMYSGLGAGSSPPLQRKLFFRQAAIICTAVTTP